MFPFSNIKPRRFDHKLMYSDERRRRLQEMELRARRELGMLPDDRSAAERLEGAFTSARDSQVSGDGRPYGHRVGNAVLIVLILALSLFLYYIVAY